MTSEIVSRNYLNEIKLRDGLSTKLNLVSFRKNLLGMQAYRQNQHPFFVTWRIFNQKILSE
jgi:hypothetical protein